jgi:hypothetical protein
VRDSTALRVFLAHSKEDKSLIREVFFLLKLDGFLPWFDEESLVAGHNWKLEIEKAVEASDVVVLFISPSGVDRAGYLQKEIALAIDVAERQPEGRIYLIPVRLGECEMPRRLSHLHWISSPRDPNSVADVYCGLQEALLTRESELGLQRQRYVLMSPGKHIDKRVGPLLKARSYTLLKEGRYLVRGQNPDGSRYYGIAVVKHETKVMYAAKTGKSLLGAYATITWDIDGLKTQAQEEPRFSAGFSAGKHGRDPDTITLVGDYKVSYKRLLPGGAYKGTWGNGGTEELIPAARRHD